MRIFLTLTFVFLTTAVLATPQPILGPIISGMPIPFGDKFIGGIGTLGNGGGGGGGSCGTINLSSGCVQPMLGGL